MEAPAEALVNTVNTVGVMGKGIDLTAKRIDGFESPLGMELLATVDWLMERQHREPTVESIRTGLREWPAGEAAAERKLRLFDDRLISLAIEQLTMSLSA